jgi:sulfur-carrier protein
MARVFIPPTLRWLTNQIDAVDVEGQTVRELIDRLDSQFPGIKSQLVQNDRLRSGWMIAVGTAVATAGLRESVAPNSEVHFLPAIGGG